MILDGQNLGCPATGEENQGGTIRANNVQWCAFNQVTINTHP